MRFVPVAFLAAVVGVCLAACDTSGSKLVIYSSGPEIAASSVDGYELAKCLTRTGYRLYGTKMCSACRRQKEMFGERGAKELKYIECRSKDDPAGREECQRMEIRAYPTWVLPDGSRLVGVQTLEYLAERSGCR